MAHDNKPNCIIHLASFLQGHTLKTAKDALTQAPYHIKTCTIDHGNQFLVTFQYTPNSNKLNPIVAECRGIVFAYDPDTNKWTLAAFPFKQFFNYGEKYKGTLMTPNDLTIGPNTQIMEKKDGSLVFLYSIKLDGKQTWMVGTTGTPDGSLTHLKVDGKTVTIKELFWTIFNDSGYQLPGELNYTFMFELVSPCNPIIVKQTDHALFAIGARNNLTAIEYLPNAFAKKYNWQLPTIFKFNNVNNIVEAANKLDPLVQEGYVLTDDTMQRVKFKSRAYIEMSNCPNKGQVDPDSKLIQTTIEFSKSNEEYLNMMNLDDAQSEFIKKLIQLEHDMLDIMGKFDTWGTKGKFAGAVKGLWFRAFLLKNYDYNARGDMMIEPRVWIGLNSKLVMDNLK